MGNPKPGSLSRRGNSSFPKAAGCSGFGLYCGMFGAMLTSLHAAGIRSSDVGSSGFVLGSLGLSVQSRVRDNHSLQDAVSMQQGIRSSFPSHSISRASSASMPTCAWSLSAQPVSV